jgi:hypothetical protein
VLSVEPKARLITLTETLVIRDINKPNKKLFCYTLHFITLSTNNDLSHKITFVSQGKQ